MACHFKNAELRKDNTTYKIDKMKKPLTNLPLQTTDAAPNLGDATKS